MNTTENTTENQAENSKLSNEKTLEAMKNFSETYAKRTGTYFCSEPSVTAVVIEGLAKHKDELGAPLCPCRHYEDKEAEVKAAYWNCPCIPMRERKECHCMLFLTPDNDFAGTNQEISMEQLQTVRETM
ncbi:MAG: ferredoxin--nitrite reductase [Oscillatoriales cyanobacterium RU_3_3]|nr:ferredoxin--nitrite reductase [Microcoleus sp. SU_5_6]NJL67869.1 ferredoxin--nitrite reductase [Microcoleus sp. SM1_3_4]NJM62070.1 ferredoxin--nitrite reductase [Oscillatoriales cyanobacterium RU_3_3]NJR25440.1 ferredoxin--nitrite reductase [Richelia sp. CSU_2_1]